MRSERKAQTAQPGARIWLIVMLWSVMCSVGISAIFLFVEPLEPWLLYWVLAAIWVLEFIMLAVYYSFYKKASDPGSNGLVSNETGARRPDFGSESPSHRHK